MKAQPESLQLSALLMATTISKQMQQVAGKAAVLWKSYKALTFGCSNSYYGRNNIDRGAALYEKLQRILKVHFLAIATAFACLTGATGGMQTTLLASICCES